MRIILKFQKSRHFYPLLQPNPAGRNPSTGEQPVFVFVFAYLYFWICICILIFVFVMIPKKQKNNIGISGSARLTKPNSWDRRTISCLFLKRSFLPSFPCKNLTAKPCRVSHKENIKKLLCFFLYLYLYLCIFGSGPLKNIGTLFNHHNLVQENY